MKEVAPDYWTERAHSIESWQPKKEVAEYIETCGLKVPRRFVDAEEAFAFVRDSVGAIILRSEDPLEYDGPSGLLESFVISPKTIQRGQKHCNELDLEGTVPEDVIFGYRPELQGSQLKGAKFSRYDIECIIQAHALEVNPVHTIENFYAIQDPFDQAKNYRILTDQPPAVYEPEQAMSFWEFLPGRNITIVEDDAQHDSYHLFIMEEAETYEDTTHFAALVEPDGTIRYATDYFDNDVDPNLLQQIIDHYKNIQTLERFNTEHCPIMEFQHGNDGELYFLQYHRNRDRSQITETTDESEIDPKTWIRAERVRGVMSGLEVLQTAVWYPKGYGRPNSRYTLPNREDASFDGHYNLALTEVLTRLRTAHLSAAGFNHWYSELAGGHAAKSRFFKPEASLALPYRVLRILLSEPEYEYLSNIVHRHGQMARFTLEVISDGINGYVRRSPDQPEIILTES